MAFFLVMKSLGVHKVGRLNKTFLSCISLNAQLVHSITFRNSLIQITQAKETKVKLTEAHKTQQQGNTSLHSITNAYDLKMINVEGKGKASIAFC